MKNYEYHRIGRLAKQLEAAGVDKAKIDRIMDGGEDVLRKTSPEKKADWLRGAMLKMDEFLDVETRKTVREGCACCLGGKRLEISRRIAKDNDSLEDRIKAANETHYVGSIKMQENGEILAQFDFQEAAPYHCYCLPKAKEPLSITYCFCCGGHVKHHLQTALGRKLDCTTLASALSTGGKKPCTFSFKILE